jgi:hypothetical protein
MRRTGKRLGQGVGTAAHADIGRMREVFPGRRCRGGCHQHDMPEITGMRKRCAPINPTPTIEQAFYAFAGLSMMTAVNTGSTRIRAGENSFRIATGGHDIGLTIEKKHTTEDTEKSHLFILKNRHRMIHQQQAAAAHCVPPRHC